MGRGSLKKVREERESLWGITHVWERKTENGVVSYLTSWKGFGKKSWEPIVNFEDEDSRKMLRELDAILDDPDNNPKPSWLLEHESLKASGINIYAKTPGWSKIKPKSTRLVTPIKKRGRLPKSATGTTPRKRGRPPKQHASSATHKKLILSPKTSIQKNGTEVDVDKEMDDVMEDEIKEESPAVEEPITPPPPCESEEGGVPIFEPRHAPIEHVPSSSSSLSRPGQPKIDGPESHSCSSTMQPTFAFAENAQGETLIEDVPCVSSTLTPLASAQVKAVPQDAPHTKANIAMVNSAAPSPALVSTEDAIETITAPKHETVAGTVCPARALPDVKPTERDFSSYKLDSRGILIPLPGSEFVPFNWAAHLDKLGGSPAPLRAFWKRKIGQFRNQFEDHRGKVLKVPDVHYTSCNRRDWATVGVIADVHGPWVQAHILDTDAGYNQWYMADDFELHEFISLNDRTMPACQEPCLRKSTNNFRRIVDRTVFLETGEDHRVPCSCFESQLVWEDRPSKLLFRVGQKLESYDALNGDGSFYPATIVYVDAEMVRVHKDGHSESHTKEVGYMDRTLFPCGYAAAIGWKCVLTEEATKKSSMRGRKRKSIPPVVAAIPPIIRPESYSESRRQGKGDEKDQEESRLISRNPPHSRRAPPIPGMAKRADHSVDRVENPEEKEKAKKKERKKTERMEDITLAQKIMAPNSQRTRKNSNLDVAHTLISFAGNNQSATQQSHVSSLQPPNNGQGCSHYPPEIDQGASQQDQAHRKALSATPPMIFGTPQQPQTFKPAQNPSTTVTTKQESSRSNKPNTIEVDEDDELHFSRRDESPGLRYIHNGEIVLARFNHDCNLGNNVNRSLFRLIPSLIKGSMPHVWREVLQQLINCCKDPEQFIRCLPTTNLQNMSHLVSITFDETPRSTYSHFVLPPYDIVTAQEIIKRILSEAGICSAAVLINENGCCDNCNTYQDHQLSQQRVPVLSATARITSKFTVAQDRDNNQDKTPALAHQRKPLNAFLLKTLGDIVHPAAGAPCSGYGFARASLPTPLVRQMEQQQQMIRTPSIRMHKTPPTPASTSVRVMATRSPRQAGPSTIYGPTSAQNHSERQSNTLPPHP